MNEAVGRPTICGKRCQAATNVLGPKGGSSSDDFTKQPPRWEGAIVERPQAGPSLEDAFIYVPGWGNGEDDGPDQSQDSGDERPTGGVAGLSPMTVLLLLTAVGAWLALR